jgi:hypothetical protein
VRLVRLLAVLCLALPALADPVAEHERFTPYLGPSSLNPYIETPRTVPNFSSFRFEDDPRPARARRYFDSHQTDARLEALDLGPVGWSMLAAAIIVLIASASYRAGARRAPLRAKQ